MACQFKAYARFDVDALKNQLNAGEGQRYNDSSGPMEKCNNDRESLLLHKYIVSFSPGGELLVFAHKRNLCILSAKWDSYEGEDVRMKFKTSLISNPCLSQSEEITAVICLPLIQIKSSRANQSSELTDWTCIALGFNNGHVRFYDEGGHQLLSELICEEPVQNIKCQSCHSSKTSSSDDFPEEIYVVFQSTVAIIPGFALFQTLRACRNQLARAEANFTKYVTPPRLTLQKWAFVDQERLNDCEVIGPSSSDMFDHLMTASIRGGFNATYRSGAPKSTLIVAAGKGPFVGFHHAFDGIEGRSVLTDVAQVVKSKFKAFFMGNDGDQQENNSAIETPKTLACRFGLCDVSREAGQIVRSPNREYSAVTDNLGRITLVNNTRGIAIRIWKGYRNAQCGWLQIKEEEPSQSGNSRPLLRTVLFLVIYDPKRGILEVWTIPIGNRVVTFSCSKMGRLVYTNHGLVGLNNTSVTWANKSVLPCLFLDPDGTIYQISVPFHNALSGATSERAADLALLRKLKSTLRERTLEDEQLAQEVGLLAAELKTSEVRNQMLLFLTSNKHVSVNALEAALAVFTDRASYAGTRCSENSRQALLLSSQQLRNLITFYKYVQHQREKPPKYSSVVSLGTSDFEILCDAFSVSEQEISALKSLKNFQDSSLSSESTPRKGVRVTFKEETPSGSSLVEYLSCFEFGKKPTGTVAPSAVAMKALSPSKLKSLADLLFQGVLYSDVPIEVWLAEAASSDILPCNLLQIAIHFWLHRSAGKALEVEMIRFGEIIKAICQLEEVISCDLSSFWSPVRTLLADSFQPFNGLTAGLICRAVACSSKKQGLKKHLKSPKKSAKSQPKEDSKGQDENDPSRVTTFPDSADVASKTESRKSFSEWEDVSWDLVKWNLLIGRLEEVAFLDQVLGENPRDICDPCFKMSFFSLPYTRPVISLSSILQKGRGSISELVGKWLTASGVDPKLLIVPDSDVEWINKNTGFSNSPSLLDDYEPQPEDKSEVIVREGIPLVTEEGVEAGLVCKAHAQILETLCLLRKHFPYSTCGSVLLANVSWEFIREWHKNPEQINILNAAFTYLKIIPSIHVRQGMCSLIWSAHLNQHFKTAFRIVNGSSGFPTEKLCRTDLQMSESNIADFSESCLKFLELYVEASSMSEVIHRPGPDAIVNRSEDMWDYHEEFSVSSTPSLTSLALKQPQASINHLHLFLQVALTLYIVLSLRLRRQRLTPLFNPSELSVLFPDNSEMDVIGPQLCHQRTQFLLRTVTGAMQNVLSSDPVHVTDLSSEVSSDIRSAMRWFGLCQDLADTWQISMDPIRRHQVCLLYTAGHDRLAEEVLAAVKEVDLLAQDLLLICGRRLKVIMEHSLDRADKLSSLDTHSTHYLSVLGTVGVRKVSLEDTTLLATHVLRHLPKSDPKYPRALDLFDSLQVLSSSEQSDLS